MHRLLIGFCLAIALTLGAGPAFAIDPFFPTFGNRGIDVMHYHLDLDVRPRPGNITGKAVLVVKAERRLLWFTLDLHALAVSDVKVNGIPARFLQADDKLVITPLRPIAEKSVFLLSVDYGGVPDALPDPTAPGFDPFLGWFKYRNSTYVVSEPVGASTFFPANDEPDDKATFTFALTVPFGYRGVANGIPAGSTDLGARTRFYWSMPQPMTTWLATVHVNRLNVDTTRARDGTPVRVYYPDGVPQSHVAVYALAAKMLPYFERLVGPYPFASYGSVVVQDPILYYALETQAMSTFPAGASPPGEDLVAHELAHQWFGNSAAVARWRDLWIGEGSATYFEVLWANRNNPTRFDRDMLAIYDYVADQNVGPAVVEAPDQLFTDRTYLRGAMSLYALRLKVGDRVFFNILRHFVQDNRGGNVTSEGFVQTAVRVSGDASVRPLLHDWLYEIPVPKLPGLAARVARQGPAPRPNVVGLRCGRGSHRGSPATCKAAASR